MTQNSNNKNMSEAQAMKADDDHYQKAMETRESMKHMATHWLKYPDATDMVWHMTCYDELCKSWKDSKLDHQQFYTSKCYAWPASFKQFQAEKGIEHLVKKVLDHRQAEMNAHQKRLDALTEKMRRRVEERRAGDEELDDTRSSLFGGDDFDELMEGNTLSEEVRKKNEKKRKRRNRDGSRERNDGSSIFAKVCYTFPTFLPSPISVHVILLSHNGHYHGISSDLETDIGFRVFLQKP